MQPPHKPLEPVSFEILHNMAFIPICSMGLKSRVVFRVF